MSLLMNYLTKEDFIDYDDFKNNFEIKIPEDFDFARDIVDYYAINEPNKLALIYCNDDNEEIKFTFKDISIASKKCAAYFKKIGIKARDRVFTLLRRRYEYWIVAVALHRLGAVVVPGAIQLKSHDIAYRIRESHATAIIALNDDFVNNQLIDIEQEFKSLKIVMAGEKYNNRYYLNDYKKCEELEEYSNLTNDDEMLVYFTSGTTGYPKMAVHNRKYPLGHIITAKYMQKCEDNGLHITQADSGWAKFGWGNLYGQWICGAAVLGYDPIRFNAYRFMQIIKRYKPTSMCVPPTMYRLLLEEGIKKEYLASVKWFSTAGEPLSGEMNQEFKDITGHYIHEAFGQSECTPITASFEWLTVKPSSMGKPSPLYDVRIIKADGSLCGIGEAGEVVIYPNETHLGLLKHYILNDELIDCLDNQKIYHTGDIAYADKDGYFWYVCRNDDMIKSSGYRIGPFEIEEVLNTHESVRESAIIGLPDPIRGQIVCAIINLNADYTPSDELTKELQNYVKENTAPYKYPRRIIYVESLPKTTSGKIIRRDILNKCRILYK